MSASASPPLDGDDSGTIHTVWHGYDVVLTGGDFNERDRSVVDAASNGVATATHNQERWQSSSRQNSSLRRISLQREDYGWLRQIDLRNDVPTIDEILDWSFDVLQFEDTVLVDVSIRMLEHYNLLELFQLDRQTVQRYCNEVMKMHYKDGHYHRVDGTERQGGDLQLEKSTPELVFCEYHSWYHAVACTHSCFLLLTLGKVDAFLNPIEILSLIMGALIHDIDHLGTNNDFLVKSKTSRAKLYDNDSVNERHSIHLGLKLCEDNPDLDWLNTFHVDDCKYVKHFISEIILATDMIFHGDILKSANAFVDKGVQDYESTLISRASSKTYFDRNNPEDRLFLGRLILHAADISGPVHPSFAVAADWAVRVAAEFTKQTEKEQQLQLPITPFMQGLDSQLKIAKMQIDFFQWIVNPFFHTLGKLFSDLEILAERGAKNCFEYQALIDAHD